MDAEILKIIDFEERIFSEYKEIESDFAAVKSRLENCCKVDDFHHALLLVSFLKNEVRKRGQLPPFFDELEVGIKKFIIGGNERINIRDCVNCTLKHVSSAAVIINEILNGYEKTDHEIFLMGNLNEASEQIAETSTELSNELRNLRVDIFEKQKRISQFHLKAVKEIYRKIRALTDIKISREVLDKKEEISSENKPCGCKGK